MSHRHVLVEVMWLLNWLKPSSKTKSQHWAAEGDASLYQWDENGSLSVTHIPDVAVYYDDLPGKVSIMLCSKQTLKKFSLVFQHQKAESQP